MDCYYLTLDELEPEFANYQLRGEVKTSNSLDIELIKISILDFYREGRT